MKIQLIVPFLSIFFSITALEADDRSFIPKQFAIPSGLYCFFLPPKGWDIADPKLLSPHVQIGFFTKGKKEISPSLNLAVEETSLSLADYLKAVKAIHESDPSTRWRQLGKIQVLAGLAQLTEIDTQTEVGPMRILQMILVRDGKAYILTAGALKEEFAEHYQDFQKSFRSFQVTPDLISVVPQADRRDALKQAQESLSQKWTALSSSAKTPEALFADKSFQKDEWLPFQNMIVQQFEDMGAYWQVQILKAAQERFITFFSTELKSPKQENEHCSSN